MFLLFLYFQFTFSSKEIEIINPFGMVLPGRNYAVAGGNYRYGFNGKQKENEITEGDYDFDERMYDSRLGRFFSTDPEQENNVSYTPYAFANNNPITLVDEDGLSAAGPPWLELLSAGLDFVPIVGTIKNIAEAAIGRDLAGNELSPAERMLMVMPGGAIINKGSKAVKFIAKHADDIARGVTKVFKKVTAKSKEIYSKFDDGIDYLRRKYNDKSSMVEGNDVEAQLFEKFKAKYEKKGYKVDKEITTNNFDGTKGATWDAVAYKIDANGNMKLKIAEFKSGWSGTRNSGWSKQQKIGRDNGGVFTTNKFSGKLKGVTYSAHSVKRTRKLKGSAKNLFKNLFKKNTKKRYNNKRIKCKF